MKLARRLFLPLFLTLPLHSLAGQGAPVGAKHAPEPREFSASYKASISGVPFSGSGSRTLKKEGGDWVLEFGADAALAGMDEASRFKIKDGQVIPSNYSFKRTGLGGKKPKTAQFNWQKKTVSWQQGRDTAQFPVKAGVQDPLTYQLQLRLDLAAGKKTLSYLVADDDEIYQRKLEIEGEEILDTSAGKLNTVRAKVVRDNNDRQTWIWFAKDWDYVLVKLYQKEKKSDYTIEFKEGSVEGKKISGIKRK